MVFGRFFPWVWASVVALLASDRLAYVTGHAFVIDGGLMINPL